MSTPGRRPAVIIIVFDLLYSCASPFQVGVPSVNVIDFLSSRQTFPKANPPTFLSCNIHQPLLSQLPRDAPSFGSILFGLVSHLLNFRQGVLGFINLPLSLLQLSMIQLQLFRLPLQRLLQFDPLFRLLLQPTRSMRRPAFRIVRALFLLRELGGQSLGQFAIMRRS